MEKGGETGFAQAGVVVTPVKGSAIFWYNMFGSGLNDNMTYHGACPVIFGEKLGNSDLNFPLRVITPGDSKFIWRSFFESSWHSVDALW